MKIHLLVLSAFTNILYSSHVLDGFNIVFSEDGNKIVYIAKSENKIPEKCADFSEAGDDFGNEVRVYDIISETVSTLAENNFSCESPSEKIVDPHNLQFSPNGKMLYFMTSAWATSGALHKINVDGSNLQYVTSANDFTIVPSGMYKGNLCVRQHRYLENGESYEGYFLFDENGADMSRSLPVEGSLCSGNM